MAALTDLGPALWHRLLSSRWRPVRLGALATSRWLDESGPALGASIAFYTMFAVAPLLVVAIAIAGAASGPNTAPATSSGRSRVWSDRRRRAASRR
jgi:membrane protein